MDEFHRNVSRMLTVGRVDPPAILLQAREERLVLVWPFYAAMLFDLDIPLSERLAVKKAWQVLDTSRHKMSSARRQLTAVPDPAFGHPGVAVHRGTAIGVGISAGQITTSGVYRGGERAVAVQASRAAQALRPMLESELVARSPQEFTDLLRTIQHRSGRNAGEIAREAGIPRSQAYAMIRRGTLPTKVNQVRGFLAACGLPEQQAQHVLRLWNELHEREHQRDAQDPLVLWNHTGPASPMRNLLAPPTSWSTKAQNMALKLAREVIIKTEGSMSDESDSWRVVTPGGLVERQNKRDRAGRYHAELVDAQKDALPSDLALTDSDRDRALQAVFEIFYGDHAANPPERDSDDDEPPAAVPAVR